LDLARWVDTNAEPLAKQWLADIESRSGPWPDPLRTLMEGFVSLLIALLPGSLGPLREQVDPLWLGAAELYGSVAAMRGLAAGEVIEEFQGLRESLIRALYTRPPKEGTQTLALREVLTLSGAVDRGVTRASVGHTDAMFFALFQGSGIPPAPSPELIAEVSEQLEAITVDHEAMLSGRIEH
jgi:hypothetical protein